MGPFFASPAVRDGDPPSGSDAGRSAPGAGSYSSDPVCPPYGGRSVGVQGLHPRCRSLWSAAALRSRLFIASPAARDDDPPSDSNARRRALAVPKSRHRAFRGRALPQTRSQADRRPWAVRFAIGSPRGRRGAGAPRRIGTAAPARPLDPPRRGVRPLRIASGRLSGRCRHTTGVGSGSPFRKASRFATTSSPIARRVFRVALPWWGDRTTFSIVFSASGTRGSSS